jgi:3'-phosphoadenosine 5'-phosphosulfate sulfotransferase (PAPS reductase)/FAD synthetase
MDNFISFSGGKDSTALAALMPQGIPIFADTGAEFPETYAHLDRFEEITGREVVRLKSKQGTLIDYIRKAKFLPGHHARFCTRMFKIEVMEQFLEARSCRLAIGLRADEDRTGNKGDAPNIEIQYPLQDWGLKLWDILRICTDYNLLPRYPVYMARGGCINCFYKRKAEVQAMAQLIPDTLDVLQNVEEEVQDERGKFAYMFPNCQASIRDIRRQQFMFDPQAVYAAAAQRGDYGKACGLFCGR